VGSLKDGRTIIRSNQTQVIRGGILTWYFQLNFSHASVIDAVLDLQVRSTTPGTNVSNLTQKVITRHATLGHPVLGTTLYGIPQGMTVVGFTCVVEAVALCW